MKKPLFVTLLALSFLVEAVECNDLEAYISTLKRESFKNRYRKNELESKKLRDSWIAPIRLNYRYLRSTPYESEQTNMSAGIAIDQPIFKFGGIYYGIKYADALYATNDLQIKRQERTLIKDAVALLMGLKKIDLQIARQKLQIDNAMINLEQKREQYINGQLDSGFMNSAVIEKNIVKKAFFELETQKENLISKFHAISDLSYEDAPVPTLRFVDEEEFFARNIDMKLAKSAIKRDYYNKNTATAKYLPTVSVNGAYRWERNEDIQFGNTGASFSGETHYYNYGFHIDMPLEINTFRDIESAKVDYLQSRIRLADERRALRALYEKVMQNIENIEKKIALAQENERLYQTLLHDTEVLYQSGYKTEYDVKNMRNSLEIERINRKIYFYEKQLELLELYERIEREI